MDHFPREIKVPAEGMNMQGCRNVCVHQSVCANVCISVYLHACACRYVCVCAHVHVWVLYVSKLVLNHL